MAGGGWRPVAGQKEEEGPAPPPMRHHFYSLGLQGVLGAFVFLFFFFKEKMIKTSKLIFVIIEKLI